MSNKVTMKHIAQAMGVTATTVHRALQGKEGVSEETRRQVQKMAAQMGYRTNYMAAALKHKKIHLAIALPEPSGDNRYYYGNMWAGVRNFFQEVNEFNVIPLEYIYSFVYGANGNALKGIYEDHIDHLDGVVTMGVDQGQSSYYIEKIAQRNVPIVFVGSDMYKEPRFCCVKSYDEMAGSLAAELLTSFNEDTTPRKVVVIGHFGQLGMNDQLHNAMGFDNYIQQHAPHIQTIQIRDENYQTVCYKLEQVLRSDPDIHAVYSCSARYTIYMAETITKMGLPCPPKLIGNDIFPENQELLEKGVLAAIIDKKIVRQSYLATKTLFDFVVKGDYPPSSLIQVRPEVVLRSNTSHDQVVSGISLPTGQVPVPDDILVS